jgi:hypothetical protein
VLTDVDVRARTAKFDVQDNVRADVLNVIPPQRASAIARSAGCRHRRTTAGATSTS